MDLSSFNFSSGGLRKTHLFCNSAYVSAVQGHPMSLIWYESNALRVTTRTSDGIIWSHTFLTIKTPARL